ncbi:D-threonine aldolase [Usitatibacter rugosus]|uniref:D-threonine aldolase n=1 Tax=Usitatibacter rugosus TaxID=2732067 RepID=A0A6M4H4X7_9PROT|nr:alanine racemase [Usitatibacter rugosus]QJR12977.1 D-threonine aldolase [Usitatibacter rugosus]
MNELLRDFLDPWIGPGDKGFPVAAARVRSSQVGALGWNVLRGDLPFPLAVIREERLRGNLAWLQDFSRGQRAELAPHGKTTMSPQIFRRQLDAGAWGMTVANMAQLTVAVASGARNAIIANQVLDARDLEGLAALRLANPELRVWFLLDSLSQLAMLEARAPSEPHTVLLEMGFAGGRTGCRSVEDAVALARAARKSPAVRLAGIECYEGLFATGDDPTDRGLVGALMQRVHLVATICDDEGLFECDEVIVSAGGSALFDLVAGKMHPAIRRPVRAVLRSGCYATHDHGTYERSMVGVSRRLGCDVGLRAALEVWTRVQSTPEPGLAILTAGKRDVSYDIEMPRPVRWHRAADASLVDAPTEWSIPKMNDQHAYLVLAAGAPVPAVGDRIALGISHPCTTFDKWRWLALVDERYNVTGAVTTCF